MSVWADVEFDECVDVEEQVPVELCIQADDSGRTPIVNREIEGTKKRSEGRRTGITRRPVSPVNNRKIK